MIAARAVAAAAALSLLWAVAPARAQCVSDASRSDLAGACFADATQRYGHDVFGLGSRGLGEWGALWVARDAAAMAGGAQDQAADLRVTLPTERVFEDLAPRLVDLDGDGATEIVVVETSASKGAALAIYGLVDGRLVRRALSEPIGRRNRWLAPIGVADFDGDGVQDIAYIDRPHLARQLRIVRWAGARLVPLTFADGRPAVKTGYTNHRFGDPVIHGGIRDCGAGPEMLVADPAWLEIRAVRLGANGFRDQGLKLRPDADGFRRAQACAEPG